MNRGRQRHGARMLRRSALRFGVALTALLVAPAHTPYRQWVVYRRRVLLIGSSRDDPTGYRLGRQVAETLAHHLPESRSRASRAPTARAAAAPAAGFLGFGTSALGKRAAPLCLMSGVTIGDRDKLYRMTHFCK